MRINNRSLTQQVTRGTCFTMWRPSYLAVCRNKIIYVLLKIKLVLLNLIRKLAIQKDYNRVKIGPGRV